LLSAFFVVISHIVLATSKNVAGYIVGHTLMGIGAAPFEALPTISVSTTTPQLALARMYLLTF
jgi:hypothetical protein